MGGVCESDGVKRGPHVAAFDRRCSRRCFSPSWWWAGVGGRAGDGRDGEGGHPPATIDQ